MGSHVSSYLARPPSERPQQLGPVRLTLLTPLPSAWSILGSSSRLAPLDRPLGLALSDQPIRDPLLLSPPLIGSHDSAPPRISPSLIGPPLRTALSARRSHLGPFGLAPPRLGVLGSAPLAQPHSARTSGLGARDSVPLAWRSWLGPPRLGALGSGPST